MLSYNESSSVYVSAPSAIYSMGKVQSIPRPGKLRHIWIITGPAGCGKSSVAAFLAKKLNLHYIEGDDVSSPLPSIPSSQR
jgi:gluconokinase